MRYRPLVDPDDPEDDADRDQMQAICDAVDELRAEGPGDILVFLSGEREIRDTAEALDEMDAAGTPRCCRCTRGCRPPSSTASSSRTRGRRIVLATNVAETSLTVPGIQYVDRPGHGPDLPLQPPHEGAAAADRADLAGVSANQRKGRCGRTSDGICIRLYSRGGLRVPARSSPTPEILRTNLASVILQMTALGLGDIGAFPFVDPPDRRSITRRRPAAARSSARSTRRAGPAQAAHAASAASSPSCRSTRGWGGWSSRRDRNGCVREVMVIAAALSIQDPRERPAGEAGAGRPAARPLPRPDSDFLAYLNLWQLPPGAAEGRCRQPFRRMCQAEYLNYLRIREWQDVHSQLRHVAKQLGLTLNSDPDADADSASTPSLLAGLLSHVGLKDAGDSGDYLGARGARFAVFPGSALSKKQPRWVMSAELVETSRLWARVNARSSRSGSSRWPSTWSNAPTANRTGRRSAAP